MGRPKKSWPDIDFAKTAELVGISRTHLHNIVDGRFSPSLRVALRMADVWTEIVGYKVTVESLPRVLRRGSKNKKKSNSKSMVN